VDYLTVFKEKDIDINPLYSHDDIGVARLFYDIHRDCVRYVVEAKAWYVFGGQRWQKDEGGLRIMELCKAFVQAYAAYAESLRGNDSEDTGGKEFIKYAARLKNRRRREGILSDAKSIEPVSLSVFDTNAFLFNCTNGTLNLRSFALQPHSAGDFITKLSRVNTTARLNVPAGIDSWMRSCAAIKIPPSSYKRHLATRSPGTPLWSASLSSTEAPPGTARVRLPKQWHI
jgi:putative DNA primase/helicase